MYRIIINNIALLALLLVSLSSMEAVNPIIVSLQTGATNKGVPFLGVIIKPNHPIEL